MALLHRVLLEVFADYHQFYLADGAFAWLAPEEWSDQDLQNGAKVSEHLVVVCPARSASVPVEVAVSSRQPQLELGAYDHVVECSLSLPSGYLQLHECTGPERLHLSVEPGNYRVRALFASLASIDEDGLEGDDTYLVQLWPDDRQDLKVLKQWQGEWRG